MVSGAALTALWNIPKVSLLVEDNVGVGNGRATDPPIVDLLLDNDKVEGHTKRLASLYSYIYFRTLVQPFWDKSNQIIQKREKKRY